MPNSETARQVLATCLKKFTITVAKERLAAGGQHCGGSLVRNPPQRKAQAKTRGSNLSAASTPAVPAQAHNRIGCIDCVDRCDSPEMAIGECRRSVASARSGHYFLSEVHWIVCSFEQDVMNSLLYGRERLCKLCRRRTPCGHRPPIRLIVAVEHVYSSTARRRLPAMRRVESSAERSSFKRYSPRKMNHVSNKFAGLIDEHDRMMRPFPLESS